jgi:DNA-binding CsgD family transcriptional regulator
MREEIAQKRVGGPELLERETELAALSELVARARGGRGAMAVIEGPAGIGKTSLIRVGLDSARESGMNILASRGSELERDFPFGIVRQLFEATLLHRPKEERAELLSGAAAFADPVFSAPKDGEATSGSEASEAVLHGLYWLTADLAARVPVALAVDDSHWADPASVRFLAYLANRMTELPVFVIIGMRPFEPGAETELLEEIVLSPQAEVMRPRPLGARAVQELVRSTLGAEPEPAFIDACFQATQGNPFFLRELLGTLQAEDIVPGAEAATHVSEVAPDTVTRSVLHRINRLPGNALSLAQAVAILGDRSELHIAAKLAGLDEDSADEAAADLRRVGIFDRDVLGFVHPVVRTAIHSELAPVERARGHRDAAHILAELGEKDDQLALHLLASEPRGDPWAVAVLRRAAQQAQARGAPDGAARYLQRALAEPPPTDIRGDVLMELGRAETAAGRLAGLTHVREALELESDPIQRAAIASELARALFTVADLREAAKVIKDALAELAGRAPDLGRKLESQLLSVSLFEPAVFSELGDRLSQLLDETRRDSDPASLAPLALISVGTIEPASRGAALARRALAEGLSVLEQPDLYWFAATALLCADELLEARDAWDRAIVMARRRASMSALILASTFRVHVAIRLGTVAEAESDGFETLDRVERSLQLPRPFIVAPLIDALIERGQLERAAELVKHSGVEDDPPDQLRFAFPFASVGRLRLAEGRPGEAAHLLRECGRRLEALGIRNPGFIEWRSSLAEALAAAEQAVEARKLAEEEVDLAHRFGVRRELGMALRTAALVGETKARIERLREAVSVLEGTPAALELARALIDLGAALRRGGHRAESREPLRHGLDLAYRCGATALVERSRTELLAAGARPRRVALTGVESLTASERRVAAMAAEGLTNREIAQSLFITEKTVEGHLQHAYRKLDIRSREQIPRTLRTDSMPG